MLYGICRCTVSWNLYTGDHPMPSAKPAIATRLKPEVFAVFARLAELQNRSRGAVVADILESIYEPLCRTVALLEAARDAPMQVKQGLRAVVADMEQDLAAQSGENLAEMDWLRRKLQQPSAAPGGGAAKRPAGRGKPASTPVPVTRGSHHHSSDKTRLPSGPDSDPSER